MSENIVIEKIKLSGHDQLLSGYDVENQSEIEIKQGLSQAFLKLAYNQFISNDKYVFNIQGLIQAWVKDCESEEGIDLTELINKYNLELIGEFRNFLTNIDQSDIIEEFKKTDFHTRMNIPCDHLASHTIASFAGFISRLELLSEFN